MFQVRHNGEDKLSSMLKTSINEGGCAPIVAINSRKIVVSIDEHSELRLWARRSSTATTSDAFMPASAVDFAATRR